MYRIDFNQVAFGGKNKFIRELVQINEWERLFNFKIY